MEWISVRERSPEPKHPDDDSVSILVCVGGRVSFGVLRTDDGGRDWDYYQIDSSGAMEYLSTNITHWMPLPEPPETKHRL